MAVTTWTPGQVLAAQDLNDTFASKLPYSYGTATPSTTDSGFLWYDSNSTPAAPKFWDGSAFQPLSSGGGAIVQQVLASDTTNRTTTSGSFVDVTGMSVTITPQFSDSTIFVYAYFSYSLTSTASGAMRGAFRLTDSSNNSLGGSDGPGNGTLGYTQSSGVFYGSKAMVGVSTPASTSAQTYKLRFLRYDANVTLACLNAEYTGRMIAVEVAA